MGLQGAQQARDFLMKVFFFFLSQKLDCLKECMNQFR